MTARKDTFRSRAYRIMTVDRFEHGYTTRYVFWRSGTVESLAKTYEGTIDNKAGYGCADAAKRIGEAAKRAMADGHTLHFETAVVWGCYALDMSFQLYREAADGKPREWCEGRVLMRDDIERALRTAEILRALKLPYHFGPDALVARLAKLAPTYETTDYRFSEWSALDVITTPPLGKRKAA